MSQSGPTEIRQLLKIFGIQVDKEVSNFLADYPEYETIRIRLTLEDISDYGERPPTDMVNLKIEGEIGR
jgi:hypothetical protein